MSVHIPRVSVLSMLCCLIASSALANLLGPTGNLRGRITDITTGEPLPFANVLVVGSGRGAVTNDNGEYSVTGIPPGVYVLRASLLGYQSIEAKRVVIEVDQTTVYDFKLASTLIEQEGVTVEGRRPLVDVKKTAGDQTFNTDRIEQLPNLKGVEDVLGLQAGVVKFGNQLFLRGGRANETQILIDGVVANDVTGFTGTAGTSTANEQLQQLYSGSAGGGTGGALSVSANAIQSVSVSSSGLDAEYGNAQSGVVNITTKTGGERFDASLQYRTDGIMSNDFNDTYYAAHLGGPEPITTYLLPSLGLETPGKASFFMSGNFNQSDGPYLFSKGHGYNPVERRLKFSGFLGDIFKNAGLRYTDRQNNNFSFNAKITYAIGDNDQFAYSYRANASSARPLSGAFSWRDLYDSTTSSISLTTQNVLQWTHIFGTNTLLKGYVSRLETSKESSIGGLGPDRYSSITSTSGGVRDPNHDGFNDIGGNQSWSNSGTVVYNAKFDFSSQVHPLHFLKGGFEYYYEELRTASIAFPLARERRIDPNAPGPYPTYGLARWVSFNTPSRGALFVQDNIEFSSINIKVGLRYDFFYLGRQVASPDYVALYEFLTNDPDPLSPVPYEYASWVDYNSDFTSFEERSFLKQFSKGNVSPRLAIGYPISTRTVFYFNYGHFLQYPDRDQFFRPPVNTRLDGNYVGNPSLKPQRTIQYEAGFDQLLFEDLSLGIRGFYKDVFDYATLKRLRTVNTIDKYVNLDYASTRGFEIIVTKALSNRYSGSVGYTFQLAKGRSSNPFAAQSDPSLFLLPREVRLDYDQQHTLNVFLGYRVAANDDFDVFGVQVNNWGASLTWNFGSGFPYTPYSPGTLLADAYLKNVGEGPYTSEVNISIYKGFSFLSSLNLVFTLDITNLFDRRNVDLNAGGFNSLTGRVVQFGDYDPGRRYIYFWGPWNGQFTGSFDSRVPPFVFRSPRQITLGVKLNWN